MGGVIAAPLTGLLECFGACCGTFTAGACYQLALSGNVSSEKAARFVLMWLQVFITALAMVASSKPGGWLPSVCDKLNLVGWGEVGVCSCPRAGTKCWSDQIVYCAESAGVVVFVGLLMMALSGCSQGASRLHTVGKFMAVPIFGLVFLFLPSSLMSSFGTFATAASAVFLVFQAVLIIDFGCSWNELWVSRSLRRPGELRDNPAWRQGIIAASLALLCGSVGGSIYLAAAYPDAGGPAISLAALFLSFVLLIVSITDWVDHGALLPSCVVMAYVTYLTWEALAVSPTIGRPQLPPWVRLSVCALTLFWQGTGAGAKKPVQDKADALLAAKAPDPEADGDAEGGAPATAAGESAGAASSSETREFAKQCAVHVTAAVYIAAALAPESSSLTFSCYIAAVFLSLALYGWSLVAPKILTGRKFT